jgi:hypothetical protein
MVQEWISLLHLVEVMLSDDGDVSEAMLRTDTRNAKYLRSRIVAGMHYTHRQTGRQTDRRTDGQQA